MPYTYLQLSQALMQLAERLDDPNNNYWSQAELTIYLQESMRCWQALSGYWRNRMTFATAAGTPFYDLTAQAGTLIPFTLKDSDLVSEILYHLLEKQLSSGSYVGTDMFTLDDITKALERRRNQFLLETGMVLTSSIVNLPSPPVRRFSLIDSVIDVRRCALVEPSGPYGIGVYGSGPYGGTYTKVPLWRTNEFGAQSFNPGWGTSPADPTTCFSVAVTPPLTVSLIPPQANPAQLELLTVNAGKPLNPAAGVLMGIPDNLAWIVKFGALADLLSKAGQAQDIPRSSYCEQRWREGMQVARIHTSAVWSALNGQETFLGSVESWDSFNPTWETGVAPPDSLALASWNLLAVSSVPDGPYGVTLDVVQNAPVPILATDTLQIGREELDVILDYSEHLASFKIGGGEFQDTVPLYDNMLRLAGVYNEKLKAEVDYAEVMANRATREEALRPRRTPVEQEA